MADDQAFIDAFFGKTEPEPGRGRTPTTAERFRFRAAKSAQISDPAAVEAAMTRRFGASNPQLNPPGPDATDVADLAGPAIDIGLPVLMGGGAALAGAGLPITLLMSALGAAASPPLREAFGGLLSGQSSSDAPIGESILGAGLSLIPGAFGRKIVPKGARLADDATRIASNLIKGAKQTAKGGVKSTVAREAAEVAEVLPDIAESIDEARKFVEAGGDLAALSVAQIVPNLKISKTLAQAQALSKAANGMVDKLAKGSKTTALATGARIGRLNRRATEALVKARKDATEPLFRRAEEAFGSNPVVDMEGVGEMLQNMTERASEDAAEKITKTLKGFGMTDDFKISVGGLQRALADFGEAARGKGDILIDLGNARVSAARTAMGALRRDLDTFADVPRMGEAGEVLKLARDTYRKLSAPLNAMRDGLGMKIAKRATGQQSGSIPAMILRADPEQILKYKAAVRRAAKVSGDASLMNDLEKATGGVLARFLRGAKPATGTLAKLGEGTQGGVVSPARLSRLVFGQAGDKGEKLRALLGGKGFRELEGIAKVARAIAPDVEGVAGSIDAWLTPTGKSALLRSAAEILGRASRVPGAGAVSGLASKLADVFTDDGLSRLLATPEGRSAFRRVLRVSRGAKPARGRARVRLPSAAVQSAAHGAVQAMRLIGMSRLGDDGEVATNQETDIIPTSSQGGP